MQDSIGQKIEEKIGQKLEIDEWRAASKSDYNNLVEMMSTMATTIETLSEKVDALSK